LNTHLSLGVTLERLSQYDDALPHFRQAFELCKDESRTHPSLLRVRNCMAVLYLKQGDAEKAEPLLRELLEVQMERHADNPAHPEVLLAQNNLGGALQRQRKYVDAIKIQRDVLDKALAQPNGG
jgi:tetratricopeptide (TPR) repeat protein